jgi:hypothetical protein
MWSRTKVWDSEGVVSTIPARARSGWIYSTMYVPPASPVNASLQDAIANMISFY